jgi:hypothetical protein
VTVLVEGEWREKEREWNGDREKRTDKEKKKAKEIRQKKEKES